MALRRAIGLCLILFVAACLDPRLRLLAPDAGSKRDAAIVEDGGPPDDAGPADAGPADDAGDAGLDVDAGADGGDAGPVEMPDCGEPEPTVQAGPDTGMVLVPAGAFWQGCNDALADGCGEGESPGRCVTLSEYEIDITAVTTSQFAAFVADAGALPPDCGGSGPDPTADMPDGPVMCVAYEQAQAYCQWLGQQLPTEAQYEKAARGTDARLFPWGNEPPTCQLVVYQGCTSNYADVGSVMAGDSPYGAADMTSNVTEMVADWYDPNYYSYAPDVDPTGPTEPVQQYPYVNVMRGEVWEPSGTFTASAVVYGLVTSRRGYGDLHDFPNGPGGAAGTGFRCAKALTP